MLCAAAATSFHCLPCCADVGIIAQLKLSLLPAPAQALLKSLGGLPVPTPAGSSCLQSAAIRARCVLSQQALTGTSCCLPCPAPSAAVLQPSRSRRQPAPHPARGRCPAARCCECRHTQFCLRAFGLQTTHEDWGCTDLTHRLSVVHTLYYIYAAWWCHDRGAASCMLWGCGGGHENA